MSNTREQERRSDLAGREQEPRTGKEAQGKVDEEKGC
jgi:hypothetical protein